MDKKALILAMLFFSVGSVTLFAAELDDEQDSKDSEGSQVLQSLPSEEESLAPLAPQNVLRAGIEDSDDEQDLEDSQVLQNLPSEEELAVYGLPHTIPILVPLAPQVSQSEDLEDSQVSQDDIKQDLSDSDLVEVEEIEEAGIGSGSVDEQDLLDSQELLAPLVLQDSQVLQNLPSEEEPLAPLAPQVSQSEDSQEPQNEQGSQGPNSGIIASITNLVKGHNKMQLSALTVSAAVISYSIYKGYELLQAWLAEQAMDNVRSVGLTKDECATLESFVLAMGEDVASFHAGKRSPSAVKSCDLSNLNASLAAECNYMRDGFIKLYINCLDKDDAHEALETYCLQSSMYIAYIEQVGIAAVYIN